MPKTEAEVKARMKELCADPVVKARARDLYQRFIDDAELEILTAPIEAPDAPTLALGRACLQLTITDMYDEQNKMMLQMIQELPPFTFYKYDDGKHCVFLEGKGNREYEVWHFDPFLAVAGVLAAWTAGKNKREQQQQQANEVLKWCGVPVHSENNGKG